VRLIVGKLKRQLRGPGIAGRTEALRATADEAIE